MSEEAARSAPSRAATLRARPVLVVALVLGVVLVVLVAVLATRTTAPGTVTQSPLVGQPAPPISGTDLLNGKKVSLASERGHFVVVNFFASWCTPCSTEEPQLVAFAYSERGEDVGVIGVVYDDSAANAVQFVRHFGASWPIVTDPKGLLAAEYGVDDPPRSYLIAPDGRVVDVITGGVTESVLVGLMDASSGSSR